MDFKLPITLWILPLVMILCAGAHKCSAQSKTLTQSHDIPVEVFAVLELPLAIQEAKLVKVDKGYLFNCQLSNTSTSKIIGLRYSLVVEDEMEPRFVVNRSEGFSLKPYSTKRITFQTPMKLALKQGQRVVLMLEQAISSDSIWEVIGAKDALAAYLKGDFSVVPTVMRTANQVDAPLPTRVIYRD